MAQKNNFFAKTLFRKKRYKKYLTGNLYPLVECCHVKTVRETLKAGAYVDVNKVLDEDDTISVLQVAARHQNADMIQLLLDYGADVHARNDMDRTPLHFATETFHLDVAPVETLLKAGADPNALDVLGNTPLHLVVSTDRDQILKLLKLFSDYKVDFTARNRDNQTHLSEAFSRENFRIVDAYIQYGIDTNDHPCTSELRRLIAASGETILHKACSQGCLRLVKFLLRNGVNVNALDERGMTPLLCLLDDFEVKPAYFKTLDYLFTYKLELNVIANDGFEIITVLEYRRAVLFKSSFGILLVKEHYLGNALNGGILSGKAREFLDEFYAGCFTELRKAYKIKLHKDVTIADLIIGTKLELMRYADVPELVTNFKKLDFTKWGGEGYGYYGRLIEERFSKAIEKRELRLRAAVILGDCLGMDENHMVVRNIIVYCKRKDLKELCSHEDKLTKYQQLKLQSKRLAAELRSNVINLSKFRLPP